MMQRKRYRLWLAALLIWLGLILVSHYIPTVKAQNFARLELSAISGATGTLLTIKGLDFEAGQTVRLSMYASRLNGELVFGYARIKADGTFSWRGPLGRSSYYNRGRGEDPGTFVAPLGLVRIVAFPTDVSPSINAGASVPFTITDNRAGPEVSQGLYAFGNSSAIKKLWERTDSLISIGTVSRSWLWGPYDQGTGVTALLEPYEQGVGGWRWVTYFDKARMEITRPDPQVESYEDKPYYITNGLLVREMVTGQLQRGDNRFENRGSANLPTAGDLSTANKTPSFNVYAAFQSRNDNTDNAVIDQVLNETGDVQRRSSLDSFDVRAVNLVKETNHYIASPFWTYLNSTGPIITGIGTVETGRLFDPVFYATGLPITEAFWTTTLVGGQEKTVLVQLFERRVLTYTPGNTQAYQVEMGNVGLQYFEWRYGKRN